MATINFPSKSFIKNPKWNAFFLIVCAALLFIIGAVFGHTAYQELVIYPSWPEYGAVVTRTDRGYRGRSRTIYYQYQADGRMYQDSQRVGTLPLIFSGFGLKQFTVRADPDNLAKSYVQAPIYGWMAFFSAVLFIIFGVYFSRAVKKELKKEKK